MIRILGAKNKDSCYLLIEDKGLFLLSRTNKNPVEIIGKDVLTRNNVAKWREGEKVKHGLIDVVGINGDFYPELKNMSIPELSLEQNSDGVLRLRIKFQSTVSDLAEKLLSGSKVKLGSLNTLSSLQSRELAASLGSSIVKGNGKSLDPEVKSWLKDKFGEVSFSSKYKETKKLKEWLGKTEGDEPKGQPRIPPEVEAQIQGSPPPDELPDDNEPEGEEYWGQNEPEQRENIESNFPDTVTGEDMEEQRESRLTPEQLNLQGLEASIQENPYDRERRLIYSDALEEAGDEEGAERQRRIANEIIGHIITPTISQVNEDFTLTISELEYEHLNDFILDGPDTISFETTNALPQILDAGLDRDGNGRTRYYLRPNPNDLYGWDAIIYTDPSLVGERNSYPIVVDIMPRMVDANEHVAHIHLEVFTTPDIIADLVRE